MRKVMSLCTMWAIFICAGMTYAADIEVNGDFKVTSGGYYYSNVGAGIAQLTPRCPCDVSATGPSECEAGFRSAVDLGETCYDWASSPVAIVYRYDRTVLPSLWVPLGGEAYVPTPGAGILLRSRNGICFRITVDDIGTLHSTQVTCPVE